MPAETFLSLGKHYKVFTFPSLADGKKYPAVLLVHGNAGLTAPFGDQIRGFAEDLSKLGYFAAVPKYYDDDEPHVIDQTPHVQTLADAIAEIAKRPGVDPVRVGLIGFSLGATTCMTYIAAKPSGTIGVFADFFGFLTAEIRTGVSKFPPTIILHDAYDGIVDVQNSLDLDGLLPGIHQLVPPYDEKWPIVRNHSFKPGGNADKDSRQKATAWFVKHLPPVGI